MAVTEHMSFDTPAEVRDFPNGKGEILQIGGGEVGRYTLEPGWKWSEHVKPKAGTELCEAPHFQYHLSGTIHVVMADGNEFDVRPGEISVLAPGHDAWVVGDTPAVIVDWGGAHNWGKA